MTTPEQNQPPEPTPLKPGQDGFINPPLAGPSTVHPEQRELESPEHRPHSVPVVTERIANACFGHVLDADFTERHGVLYSVDGRSFKSHGDAIAWCIQNPPPGAGQSAATVENVAPFVAPAVETQVPEAIIEPVPAAIAPLSIGELHTETLLENEKSL